MSYSDIFKIRISPEVVRDDIFNITYTGGTAPVYSSMTQVLSGGTLGDSLLTGLTIPIVLLQTIDDIGYYSEFDGNILQKDVICNFVYSATSGVATQWTYTITNSSDIFNISYLNQTTYYLDWGDGSPVQNFNVFSPLTLSHTYPPTPNNYVITMTGDSPWGVAIIEKNIYVPFTGMTIPNPYGNVLFFPGTGLFASDPTNYDYIFTGDSENTISAQTSDNYTTIPFLVTGFTYSSLSDLAQYGSPKFLLGTQVTAATGSVGVYIGPITAATGEVYTAYTIDNVLFYDYPEGNTFYSILSSGITADMITQLPLVKDESLIGVVMQPEVQSNVYIERGKNTALERIQRLGEIDNMGDLEKYGYSFFNVKTYN